MEAVNTNQKFVCPQLPVVGFKMYVFPIIGIVGGALYSCYNYFYVILNGGVGKNGSTVAVSLKKKSKNIHS